MAQHARTREQFGRAIGSSRAVRHLCADPPVRAGTARAAVHAAAVAGDPAGVAAPGWPPTGPPSAGPATASRGAAACASPGRRTSIRVRSGRGCGRAGPAM
ncbi:acyl-CoA dehydrogenase family protein [Streptomyces sp. MB22_4]|uniref:acyl-CoA dehydrogenase family protein n=1 Tax=Streptomyces sp. MB22_4 TaxID=3383120 RepID=UPI0039A33D86